MYGIFQHCAANQPETTGYPTQKPLILYERIIRASSDEGDIVLDPFCGCATTPVAAERLRRRWVGMDKWDDAKDVVLERLRKEWLVTPDKSEKVMFPHIVHVDTEPPTRTDDNEMASPVLRLKIQRPGIAAGTNYSQRNDEYPGVGTAQRVWRRCLRRLWAGFGARVHAA